MNDSRSKLINQRFLTENSVSTKGNKKDGRSTGVAHQTLHSGTRTRGRLAHGDQGEAAWTCMSSVVSCHEITRPRIRSNPIKARTTHVISLLKVRSSVSCNPPNLLGTAFRQADNRLSVLYKILKHRMHTQGRHFNFSLGAKFFIYFSLPLEYWKIGKRQHFICSNLTLFIVPFFFLSFFLFFSVFLFFFLFFFFSFPLGRGATAPAPIKWRPCAYCLVTVSFTYISTSKFTNWV